MRAHVDLLRVLSLILAAIPLTYSLGIFPMVQFPEEEISLTISEHSVHVHGVYWYKNPWPIPVRQGFVLPLPIDKDHASPFPVVMQRADNNEHIRIVSMFGLRCFSVLFRANETLPVVLDYWQETPKKNARYILTSTKSWYRALNKGRYVLRSKETAKVYSNYFLTETQERVWTWSRSNFIPEADWLISWSNSK